MNNRNSPVEPPRISREVLQTVVSDPTRWRIFDALQANGPMTTQYIARAVRGNVTNVSKHLVYLRKEGVLEHRMNRLYAIPDAFLVPGDRVVDFGPILLRFDRAEMETPDDRTSRAKRVPAGEV